MEYSLQVILGPKGLTETICRYSLFLSPKSVLYWAAKACKRFTIPHELPFDNFYVHRL